MVAQMLFVVDQLLKGRDAEGQGMVEYGLILVLVSIAAVVALTTVGTDVQSVFNNIATTLG